MDAKKIIIRRKDQLNIELMLVIDQESAHETVRELTLKETKDPIERRRLEKIFGFERAKASERIIETS